MSVKYLLAASTLLAVLVYHVVRSTPLMTKVQLERTSHHSHCPRSWLEYAGVCLHRPDSTPDVSCPVLGARSVHNLFCVKEASVEPVKITKCPLGWEQFHGHCIFLLDSDADTFCPLYGAVSVYNKLCITDLKKDELASIEEEMKKKENIVDGDNKEEERACCPNGFGK